MALTPQQKQRAKTVYIQTRMEQGRDFAYMLDEALDLILTNPSAAQKTALRNFMQARKAASEAQEAAIPTTTATLTATLDAEQADLAAIITELT